MADLALQPRVLGRVDDPHPAVAEFGSDGIRTRDALPAPGRGGMEYLE